MCVCVCAYAQESASERLWEDGIKVGVYVSAKVFFFFCHGVEDASDEQVTYGFQICLSILKELIALIRFF